MKKNRSLMIAVVVAVLAGLIYLQIRTWRHFDWEKFKDGTEGINYWHVLVGCLCIYATDIVRAVRWKIFLRPTAPRASFWGLIAPQYVGFGGLALLGRPGEFIRPYLIAKRENLTIASQIAIWFVERAFDFGAVIAILSVDIFFVPSIRDTYPAWHKAGWLLIALFIGFVVLLASLATRGPALASWVCRRIAPFSQRAATAFEKKLRAMAGGLNVVKDAVSFIEAAGLSLALWLLVALAYREVTRAFPGITGLQDLELPEVILLMGASVAGGVLQLPVVGGGSQLFTIGVLSGESRLSFVPPFSPEYGVPCGILLWLVTFMSVVPLGLLLARFEHVSLRRLSEESQASEKAAESVLARQSKSG